MNDKRVIAVVGATGAQGGGLVRAILADGAAGFAARALTRNPGSDNGKALADAGAEVVEANIDDEASVTRALQGAYGAFFVTNFWEHFTPEREFAQAGNLARAAKAAGIQHAIWSTLEDTRQWVPLWDSRMPSLMGEYKVPHFDAKGAANRLFVEAGVPTTFLLTSFYWENFIHFGLEPKRGADGRLAITLPIGDAKLPGIAAEDIGKCALGIFRRGAASIGATVGIAGEHLTGAQMAAAMSEALSETVAYNPVSPEVFRGFGFPGAEDIGNMFQFMRDFEKDFCDARSVEVSRALNPALQSFRAWLAHHAKSIPVK